MAFVQSIHMLPQVGIPSVELIAQIAMEDLMLGPTVSTEFFEIVEDSFGTLVARVNLRRALRIRIEFDVIAWIEDLGLLPTVLEDEIVDYDVIFKGFRVVVAVSANFADVFG